MEMERRGNPSNATFRALGGPGLLIPTRFGGRGATPLRLHVSGTRIIDTWNSKTSWSTPYIRLETGTSVRAGDLVEVATRSDLAGHPSYSVTLSHQGGGWPREIGHYSWTGD